ncbi:MAG: FmdE family protein [Thermodesulfobacteriota bacterium]
MQPNGISRHSNTAPDTIWCISHKGEAYSFDSYMERVREFHGHAAPGLVIGGKMVHEALRRLPQGDDILLDALCETGNCLPDAVQLLTPCTIGNGWLKITNLFRFALTIYDKSTGEGIRVAVDAQKVRAWDEINSWFFHLKPKKDQDTGRLMEQIRTAGAEVLTVRSVRMSGRYLEKPHLGKRSICPVCREAYPAKNGPVCRACQGNSPYVHAETAANSEPGPVLLTIPVNTCEGKPALHDMTRVVPGESKGPAFVKGQQLTAGDICRLQQMGRERIYTLDDPPDESRWVHEDTAAENFARAIAGEGVSCNFPPREGKIDFIAARDGLLMVATERLEAFNLLGEVMCATRKGYSLVGSGRKLGGTRAIPLYLPMEMFSRAMDLLSAGPLLEVLPLRKMAVGILVTGTEIFQGLVPDAFIPVITSKVTRMGCHVIRSIIVPDERDAISRGLRGLLASGAELIVTTAGLSVDPDDVTRQGLQDAGAEEMLYGAPILPGAMTLITRIGRVPVIGVPACGLYHPTTSFDLLLPRLLAGIRITRRDLARLGHGAFCWECKTCRYPKCSFGNA